MGADRGILVETEEEVQPLAVAKILKHLVEKESPQLVITGKQAIDDDNNQTGQILAALLGWSQGTFASKLEFADDRLKLTREVDGGLETVSLSLPSVVTTDLRLNEPRFVKLPNIMKAKKKQLDIIPMDSLGLDTTSRVKILKVEDPPQREAGIKVDSVEELIDKLKKRSEGDLMGVLVIAEHDNEVLQESTLNAVTAGLEINADISVLVAGQNCGGVVDSVGKVAGVSKVLSCEHELYEHQLAESLAGLIASIASDYTHILAAATSQGKNVLPRVAGLLDVAPISEITDILSADTFVRPIYAGNAIATVQSEDTIKIVTIRPTTFDAAAVDGGNAGIVSIDPHDDKQDLSQFLGHELTQSDRPELTRRAHRRIRWDAVWAVRITFKSSKP